MANKIGGKRAGAGRKPAPPLLKKEPICIKLPRWLIDRMADQPQNRAVMIETALREKHGWQPPES